MAKSSAPAHWFGCNRAQGLRWDRLKDSPVPGADEVFRRAEIDFPRAAASIANHLSALFRSFWLSGRGQSLLNSNISLPFLSVLTGRGRYSLGSLAGARSWKWWPEASVTGIRACRAGGSTTSGRAGRGAAAGAGLHLALDRPLRRLRSWWSTRRQARHYPVWGRGKVDPSKSYRISFFIISQFLCH